MLYLIRSLLRFVRTLRGVIILGITSFLLIVSVSKVTAQVKVIPYTQSAAAQIQALEQEKYSRTPAQRKISSALLYAIKAQRRDALFQRVPSLRSFVKASPDGKVRVNIKLNTAITPQLLQKIQSTGAQVRLTVPQYQTIQVVVPLTQVEALANSPEVRSVRPYSKPILRSGTTPANVAEKLALALGKPVTNVGKVTSEGDVAHGAAIARTKYKVDGTGIKIGALSDSYNNQGGAAADIASGDLPAEGVTLVGSGDNNPNDPGLDEGRAMLQIIHDLAPGAKLYFATANNGEEDFANNILALRQAGCDIIVDDVGYLEEPVYQDGIIAQAVNQVTADGALYFSSAGNEGNKKYGTAGAWEGNFVDGGSAPFGISGKIHNFGSRLLNPVTSASGAPTVLEWSDAFGKSANDYDLYVVDRSGTNIVAASTNVQNGQGDPLEEVASPSTNSQLMVILKNGSPRYLHLDTFRGRLATSTRGELFGHAAAADAYAVAAVRAQNRTTPFTGGPANSIETFSSDGSRRIFYQADGTPITPRNFLGTGGEVRRKPDITAADGVVTTLPPPFNPFSGTSAAAPHAAAIAGLLKSFKPDLTTQQIRSILTRSALDIEARGFDIDSGYGIVMADRALDLAAQSQHSAP